jgi:hypothetical protein
MPASQLRRVHRLHLRSSHETLNRRGAILLEDALRTASLPDGGGSRLLLVRLLSLGRFRASIAPASLALLIEQRVRECCARAVSAQDPSAPMASAVYFRDEVEPYVSLAVRLAKQGSVDAWFWPLAARGWNPGMSRDDALLVLLAGICQTEAAWAGVLSLVRVLLNEDALSPVLGSLRRQHGVALMGLFGWSAPTLAPAAVARPRADPRRIAIPADWRTIAANWIRSWGGEDARSLWLAGVLSTLAARENGQAFATLTSDAMHEARRLIGAFLAADLRPESLATAGDITLEKPGAQAATDARLNPEPGSQASEGQDDTPEKSEALTWTDANAGIEPRSQSFDGRDDSVTSPLIAAPVVQKELTYFGGLFFLIGAMQRTGLPDWLQSSPEMAQWEFPALILRAIARRLRASEDDPVLMALFCSPQEIPAEVDTAIRIWISKLRRWCRRIARVGFHSLICRPGRITFTETHIDVAFHAADADIRVRKAGLDIDPGWTPWLGRVIHFHYLSRDEFDV